MARELMEADVSAQIGAELGERSLERTPTATATGPATGTPGSARSSWPSPVAPGLLLPVVLGAAPAGRAGLGRGGAGGLCQRRVDPQGRPAGGADGPAPPGQHQVCGCAAGWTSRSPYSGSGRWPVPTRTCGWTPRWSGSASRVAAPQGVGDRHGAHESGRREAIGLDVGEAETEAFWREFLRGCGPGSGRRQARHLRRPRRPQAGDRAGAGLRLAALHRPLPRQMLGHVTRAQQPLVSGAIRGIFTATSAAEARARLGQVVEQCARTRPRCTVVGGRRG